MKDVRIQVLRIAEYSDLSQELELPMEHPCMMEVGQTFVSRDAEMPEGFCSSAWLNLQPFVLALASGGSSIFNDWMKNPYSACISCNDGVRPVSFLLLSDPGTPDPDASLRQQEEPGSITGAVR